MPLPELASHRGGAFLWPENSLLAFRHAAAYAAEQVELDIHLSRDGEPVVMHDATLDRTTDGAGAVASLDWAALRRLRVRGTGGEGVPHLRDAAHRIREGGKVVRLEAKSDAAGTPYPGLVRAAAHALGRREDVVFMAFEPASAAEAAALGGWRDVVLLVAPRVRRATHAGGLAAAARACGATELGFHIASLDAALAAALRDAGLRVSVWGADHAPTLRRALDPALHLGAIATDDPPLAAEMRAKSGGLRSPTNSA